jgi:hypothetical protein
MDMEHFAFMTVSMQDKAAVSNHSIHIKDQQSNPSCPLSHLFFALVILQTWLSLRIPPPC